MQTTTFRPTLFYGWLIAGAVFFLGFITIGLRSGFGVFVTPMANALSGAAFVPLNALVARWFWRRRGERPSAWPSRPPSWSWTLCTAVASGGCRLPPGRKSYLLREVP